jgi:O-antigen/teichoic acid export membrane protein
MKADGKTLLGNSAWSFLNQLVRVGALAAVLIALSRHFGPARFGSLVFGLAFVRVFAVIAGFGLERILVRRWIEQIEEGHQLLRSAFLLKLTIGLLSYAALLALVFLLNPHDRLTFSIVLLAGASLPFQAFDAFDYLFQATNQFRLTFLGRTLPVLVSSGIKLGSLIAGAPLLSFAALETLEAALIGGALFLVYRCRRPSFPARRASLSIGWSSLLRDGFPLVLLALAVMLYLRSDILLLGKMAGFRAAGLYSAASQVTEACALFPMAFVPALFPLLVRWRRRGTAFYQAQFEKLFSGAVFVGLLVAVTLTMTAPWIVRLLYGAAYQPAAGILVVHAWTAVFVYLAIMQSGYDITEGLTWLAAWRMGVGAALNIALNLILIPRWGAIGSAVATLISQFGSAFLFNAAHTRTRPIFFMQLRAFSFLPLVRAILPAAPVAPGQLVNPGSVAR